MPMYKALLKNVYNNFSLTILDYCTLEDLIYREKHFFNVYSPEYNVLNTPGSSSRGSGWKHSEALIEKMRKSALSRSNINLYLYNPNAQSVQVTNLQDNKTTDYHAIRAAARYLGIDNRYIEHYIYIDNSKPVLGKYIFKLIETI